MSCRQQRLILSHLKTTNAEVLSGVVEMLSQRAQPFSSEEEGAHSELSGASLPSVHTVWDACDSYLVDVRHQIDHASLDLPDFSQSINARTWVYIDIQRSIIAAVHNRLSLTLPEIWVTLCRESGFADEKPLAFAAIPCFETFASAASRAQTALQAPCLAEVRLPQRGEILDKYSLTSTALLNLCDIYKEPIYLKLDFMPQTHRTFGQFLRAKWNSLVYQEEENETPESLQVLSPMEACQQLMDATFMRPISCDMSRADRVAEAVKEILNREAL